MSCRTRLAGCRGEINPPLCPLQVSEHAEYFVNVDNAEAAFQTTPRAFCTNEAPPEPAAPQIRFKLLANESRQPPT
jgi:hypothetical protein